MNNPTMQQFINKYKPKEKLKICANHPVSIWKEGYKQCYWGFKLHTPCTELVEEEGGEDNK